DMSGAIPTSNFEGPQLISDSTPTPTPTPTPTASPSPVPTRATQQPAVAPQPPRQPVGITFAIGRLGVQCGPSLHSSTNNFWHWYSGVVPIPAGYGNPTGVCPSRYAAPSMVPAAGGIQVQCCENTHVQPPSIGFNITFQPI